MKKILILSFILSSLIIKIANAGEGMWIPLLLQQYNIKDMQKEGFKLTAEDIYSINQASLKDAVMIFGRGCTGELISDQGLLITNHHCGYGAIQSHSSVDHDYLTNGYWAMNKSEELVNDGLTATFLVKIKDVSNGVLKNVKKNMSEEDRYSLIQKNIDKLEKKELDGTHYEAVTKPFYYGNEYYMFIYEVYKDIRLVGAPPSAIGKFGGDTDNWMWPRHTGDFSIFRIYADKENKPAEYSQDNVPYNPKKHLTISLKGVKKNDFTMVMGYPGSTEQFLTADGVKQITDVRNPNRKALRDIRLEIMNEYMLQNADTRIKYSAKYAHTSNSWKRWQGENRGLKRLNAIEKKEKLEKDFLLWANENKDRQKEYGNLINEFKDVYTNLNEYVIARDYFLEAVYPVEIVKFAASTGGLLKYSRQDDQDAISNTKNELLSYSKSFYKDYKMDIDKDICEKLLPEYSKNVNQEYFPEIIDSVNKQFNGDYSEYIENVFSNSIFTDSSKTNNFLRTYSVEDTSVILNDPAYRIFKQFYGMYRNKVKPQYYSLNDKLDSLYRIYVRGLRLMQNDKLFYPDANFTMRIAYGKVDGFVPKDAVDYNYYTTLKGVIDKDNPEIYDYNVPEKLKELYTTKDYGIYGEDGKMHVCFIASNHTSGGNSGSPVLNAEGQLIGVNFDRNWEGTMSDIMYDPDMCRNITLDIRYALFLIDKFAGASHLIDEMSLVK
ncbi:MAG: S46 family peptidase [Bacteroidales bacterium]|jgi:hypothetical protein|nr:S46 family peptidase [Bacteroidales bacterium]